MEVLTVMNGKLQLVLKPTNEMEEKILEQLATQDNAITVIRNGVSILGRTISKGLVISSKDSPLPVQGTSE